MGVIRWKGLFYAILSLEVSYSYNVYGILTAYVHTLYSANYTIYLLMYNDMYTFARYWQWYGLSPVRSIERPLPQEAHTG